MLTDQQIMAHRAAYAEQDLEQEPEPMQKAGAAVRELADELLRLRGALADRSRRIAKPHEHQAGVWGTIMDAIQVGDEVGALKYRIQQLESSSNNLRDAIRAREHRLRLLGAFGHRMPHWWPQWMEAVERACAPEPARRMGPGGGPDRMGNYPNDAPVRLELRSYRDGAPPAMLDARAGDFLQLAYFLLETEKWEYMYYAETGRLIGYEEGKRAGPVKPHAPPRSKW